MKMWADLRVTWLTPPCVALVTSLVVGPAVAAPGDLDATFGTEGIVETAIGSYRYDAAHAVVVQRDGKIVAVGRADGWPVSPGGFGLIRYDADGTLDSTFGADGRVVTVFSGVVFPSAYDVALQNDGKIVVVGGIDGSAFAVVRYDRDGSLDPSFGIGGIVLTDLAPTYGDQARAVAIQPDGAIVVVGTSNEQVAVVRYTSDGRLDATFGSGGVVTLDLGDPSHGPDWGNDVALQPDGKIIVVSLTAVARLNVDGSLDSSFGSGGKVSAGAWPTITNLPVAVVLQPDGKIVVAGTSSRYHITLVRYNADGTADLDFGDAGFLTTEVNDSSQASAVAVQADGNIVVVGFTTSLVYPYPFFVYFVSGAVIRYKPDGRLDETFGSGGVVTTSLGYDHVLFHGVAIQPDGRILAAGAIESSSSLAGWGLFLLARYLAADVRGVAIDIRPASDANHINVRGKGVVAVAILGTADFDVSSVEPASVRFGPAGAAPIHDRGHLKDVDGDGNSDLVLRFRIEESGIASGTTEACVTGQIAGGVKIQGCGGVEVR